MKDLNNLKWNDVLGYYNDSRGTTLIARLHGCWA